MTGYKLYGAEVSYYSGKARAYLRWKGVPFVDVAATQDVYKNVILPNVGWAVIPVLETPEGQIIQDTADIITHVEKQHSTGEPVQPSSGLQAFVSALLHLYGDEWLVLPAMHYRWNHNEEWTYGEFGRMSAPDRSTEEQYDIGRKNGQKFKGALPVLGISEATAPGVEASYLAFLDDFSRHLESHSYLLGDRPSLGDFAFIGPLYAHLYRDPASRDLMLKRAPKVADWVERVYAGQGGSGDLVDGDSIPDTLLPILARQMREQIPALMKTIAHFQVWQQNESAGSFVPRGLGEITIEVEGRNGPAIARSFPLFRLQDVLDAYAGLTGDERTRADVLLEEIGGEEITKLKLPRRLMRKDYRLALA